MESVELGHKNIDVDKDFYITNIVAHKFVGNADAMHADINSIFDCIL